MPSNKDKGKRLLENAYNLATPADNVVFYREFSATYDDVFAGALGFALPQIVTRVFRDHALTTNKPIADLGCGTGLVGVELAPKFTPIDGLDISAEMLASAKAKGVYRNLIQVDLTKTVEPTGPKYGAVLSSGTLTHGHLGPDAIDTMILLGKPNCLFVLSVNKAHFETHGFGKKFRTLQSEGAITAFTTEDVAIYTEIDHDHSGDRAFIVSFRKV
jgi:predicted TPR repeat methyltransferase